MCNQLLTTPARLHVTTPKKWKSTRHKQRKSSKLVVTEGRWTRWRFSQGTSEALLTLLCSPTRDKRNRSTTWVHCWWWCKKKNAGIGHITRLRPKTTMLSSDDSVDVTWATFQWHVHQGPKHYYTLHLYCPVTFMCNGVLVSQEWTTKTCKKGN